MSHKMNYDTLTIELGQVALQRDTYRELCGELLEYLKDFEKSESVPRHHRLIAASIITKAEAILGENNAT